MSGREKVLPELLCVLEDRSLRCSALHSTSDGEIKDIFALALVACPGTKGDRTLQLILRYLQSQRNAVPAAKAHSATAGCHHGEVVGMTLSVLSKVVQNVDVPIASPIALQLAEALRPLFDKACQEPLLQATTFLKMRKLTRLLKRQQTWEVGECLLTEPSSRADEYLLQSLL
ncbi:maestro heat-like repeat family member 5 [Grus japonensis]|uniref:Maestro heat-like repeat family member 5 n=1 Tax=Grus japonensis TaxID=30415 RepID=A0ABC9X2T2_GRUJA